MLPRIPDDHIGLDFRRPVVFEELTDEQVKRARTILKRLGSPVKLDGEIGESIVGAVIEWLIEHGYIERGNRITDLRIMRSLARIGLEVEATHAMERERP